MEIKEFLSYLKKVKKTSKGWSALCPAHDDRNNSLCIAGINGKILIKCFGGCTFEKILSALNLKAADLFFDEDTCVNRSYGKEVKRLNVGPKALKDIAFSVKSTVKDEAIEIKRLNSGLTLLQLSELKKLPIEFLSSLGVL